MTVLTMISGGTAQQGDGDGGRGSRVGGVVIPLFIGVVILIIALAI